MEFPICKKKKKRRMDIKNPRKYQRNIICTGSITVGVYIPRETVTEKLPCGSSKKLLNLHHYY